MFYQRIFLFLYFLLAFLFCFSRLVYSSSSLPQMTTTTSLLRVYEKSRQGKIIRFLLLLLLLPAVAVVLVDFISCLAHRIRIYACCVLFIFLSIRIDVVWLVGHRFVVYCVYSNNIVQMYMQLSLFLSVIRWHNNAHHSLFRLEF